MLSKAFKTLAITLLLVVATFPLMPIDVRVTAYAPIKRLCDSTPDITASGVKVRSVHHYKLIALSDDLARKYKFGQKFKLKVGKKEYIVVYEDRMAHRWRKTVDLIMPSYRHAKQFGVQRGTLTPIKE